MANSVTLTFGYSNTDFTRSYKFDNVETAALASVKANILAFNASIAGGTDDGIGDFFISDDYDATDSENVIGKCTGVVEAQYTAQTVTDIPLT